MIWRSRTVLYYEVPVQLNTPRKLLKARSKQYQYKSINQLTSSNQPLILHQSDLYQYLPSTDGKHYMSNMQTSTGLQCDTPRQASWGSPCHQLWQASQGLQGKHCVCSAASWLQPDSAKRSASLLTGCEPLLEELAVGSPLNSPHGPAHHCCQPAPAPLHSRGNQFASLICLLTHPVQGILNPSPSHSV